MVTQSYGTSSGSLLSIRLKCYVNRPSKLSYSTKICAVVQKPLHNRKIANFDVVKTALLTLLLFGLLSARAATVSPDISNQTVTSFAEDDLGHVWIGTMRGLNKYTSREFHQYYSDIADSLSLSHDQVTRVFRDSHGRLWIGTRAGVNLYTERDNFRRIDVGDQSQNVAQIVEDSAGRVYVNLYDRLLRFDEEAQSLRAVISDLDTDRNFSTRCHTDREGNLWAVSSNTVRRYDTSGESLAGAWRLSDFVHYSFLQDNGLLWLASGTSLSIFDTRTRTFSGPPPAIAAHPALLPSAITLIAPWFDNSLLINTTAGLFLYDMDRGTVISSDEDGFPFTAPDFFVTCIFTDSQRNLWLGSADHGFKIVYGYTKRFNANNYLFSYFENRSVTALGADRSGNLWIVSPEIGVSVYNSRSRTIRTPDISWFSEQQGSRVKNRITKLFIDRDDFVWFIAERNVLFKCRVENGDPVPVHSYWLPIAVNTMLHDSSGTIWAAGTGGNAYLLKEGEENFSPLPLYKKGTFFTNQIKELSDGRILVASFAQNPVLIDHKGRITDSIDIRRSLKHPVFVPTAVCEDSRKDVWFGALFNGLYRWSRATGEITPFPQIACPDVCSVEEDAQGNIWVGTLFGLSKLDRESGNVVNYYRSDGTGGNQFNERASYRTQAGTLIFGGTHGLTFFNPSDAEPARKIPLVFEHLRAGNDEPQSIVYSRDVRLRHSQGSFFISFAAIDYSEFDRVRYFYKMEGVDGEWLDAGGSHQAYYSNMPAGRYTFSVRVTDKDNTRVEAENSIAVRIVPAPLTSLPAMLFYLLALGAAAFFAGRFYVKVRKERRAAELNRMNMSFFANVSHEFRTPLTMISGPVNTLVGDETIVGDNKKLLHIVRRSVDRMLKLVGQLMDFNKLEGDMLRLRVRRADVVSALAGITDIFRFNAAGKQVEIQTSGLEDTFLTWLDVDKLDKIMGNLLSNAMKFTPAGGRIKVSLDHRSEKMTIEISDTGRGIPEDQIERIFERYYQVIDSDTNTHNMGTGIGLYYARRLARLHHGDITASNNADGGATFTLTLPVADTAYPPEERVVETEHQEAAFPLATNSPATGDHAVEDDGKARILVVDDDTEISHYLATLLVSRYKVINRFDAESALRTLVEDAPDLIISDVVMISMSGYEFCRTIKNDPQLCHIPVVLVTAKTNVENQVEGLDAGSDAYVTKPFDPNYLLALLKSLLKNRENVRAILTRGTRTDKLEKDALSPYDKAFMTEVYRLMEAELSNSELNISLMTEALKISRTKLYYKIKGLTGSNPNVFFRTYRLNRAAELLGEGRLNISEIADRTGFATLSHFSTSFKEQFGVSPSKYT